MLSGSVIPRTWRGRLIAVNLRRKLQFSVGQHKHAPLKFASIWGSASPKLVGCLHLSAALVPIMVSCVVRKRDLLGYSRVFGCRFLESRLSIGWSCQTTSTSRIGSLIWLDQLCR
ncbi:hypothetical protein BT63DRAFT_84502 [Microthyrium microscopicum]|uniref:Uncharacterized protein n=1 Tax=Microthyrium microscopicum TaxID=703497 RepID=A0A6A6TZ20_9PEZI|nr:hypothetical protein BT63DRAFT_84502 [Microthyrium microscopicum]